MTYTYTAAVVGLGRIGATLELDPLRPPGATHAGAYRLHPDVELVAGVDRHPGQRALFEERFGIRTYASFDEMAAEHRPDIISVSVLPENHAEVVLAAVAHGVTRIICEKPCTPSLTGVLALERALGADRDRIGVNYTRRFDPLHRLLLAKIVDLCGGSGRYTAGMSNTASHWFANLVATGVVPIEVLALPSIPAVVPKEELAVPSVVVPDPSPTVLLRINDRTAVYLEGHDVADHLIFEMDLIGRDARVQLLDSGTTGRLFERGPSPSFSGYFELLPSAAELPPRFAGSIVPVVDDAIRSITDGGPMACGIGDAIAVHRIIDAALRSLESGSWVPVGAT